MSIPDDLLEKYGDRLTLEDGADLRPHEWVMIEWILENLPKKVIVRKESTKKGVTTSDIFLDGQRFEMKQTAGTLGTLDRHVKRAVHQSRGEGAIINICSEKYGIAEATIVIMNRMRRSGLSEAYILQELRLVSHLQQTSTEFIIKKSYFWSLQLGERQK